ncbi:hypothetical protein [Hymenobacter sp. 102]|uniref:hypothetical protein n=1 Tax=Hymenobacter sp. 102 TaxID=3403152 RepID=UPI003CF34A37
MISAQFTVFSQHGRFGLLCNGQELLAPEYDAVWPLGHGFYGFRQERRYGILAPDGRIVLPVCVPACFAGYRMLDMGQQLAYASQGSQRGPRDLQRDFPGLRLHQDIPYHPTDWWAEQALADLWELNSPGRESLLLPVRSRQLALHSNGTWSWEDPEADADQLVLCGTGEAGGFSWRNQQSELLPPDTEQLLRWQARCQQVLASLQKESDSPVQPVQPAAPDAWQEADYHERALDAVLKQAGIRGLFMVDDLDFADYVPYDEDELSPAVRAACYEHLGQYVVLDEAGREAAAELLQLAWLCANGCVEVDYATGWALVDERYDCCGDFDPVLLEETTPLALYTYYCLHELEPLLRR